MRILPTAKSESQTLNPMLKYATEALTGRAYGTGLLRGLDYGTEALTGRASSRDLVAGRGRRHVKRASLRDSDYGTEALTGRASLRNS